MWNAKSSVWQLVGTTAFGWIESSKHTKHLLNGEGGNHLCIHNNLDWDASIKESQKRSLLCCEVLVAMCRNCGMQSGQIVSGTLSRG